MKSIPLARESEFMMPSTPKSGYRDQKEYPCTHLEGGKELSDLPEQGTITFTFKRRSLTKRGVEGEDESTSLCLDLQEITSVEAGKALKSTDEALSELKDSSDDEEDDSEGEDD